MTIGLHYEKYPIVLEWYNYTRWNILSDKSKAINGYTLSITLEELFLRKEEIYNIDSVHNIMKS